MLELEQLSIFLPPPREEENLKELVDKAMGRWGSAFSFTIVDPPDHQYMLFRCVEICTTANGLQCSGRAASSLALEARARQRFF